MNNAKKIGEGGKVSGGKLTTKSANFDTFYPIFFQFLPLNLQFFPLLILKIFPKKCNFEKFSTSESEKYGESFSQFFRRLGKKSIRLLDWCCFEFS